MSDEIKGEMEPHGGTDHGGMGQGHPVDAATEGPGAGTGPGAMKPGGILAWFASNHVASNLLMLFILVAGIVSVLTITIEVFPEIEGDTVTVRVPYLGASPAEAEEGVCLRVEEAIAGIEGIKRIRSVAQEGVGTVIAELEEDADNRRVLDDIKAAVDRIETFPAETEKPIISESVSRRQVITLVLYGDVPEPTLKHLADQAYDELTAMDNISQVDLAGVRRYEISIEVPEENLRRWGLTFDQVADAVRRSSLDLPGGRIDTAGGEILVRTKGQMYRGREFEDIVVLSRADGTRVRLGDIATVVDGFEDSDKAARFDGKPAALLRIYRVGSQGALDLADTVKQYVEMKRASLPPGVEAAVWDDRSDILRSRLSLLVRNAGIGLVLVFLSLAIFLDLRLALWTTMGIPISFLGGFWLIHYLDVSVNMISLFAFIVSLGIVVDDAIVVGENVFAYLEKGMRPLEAAIRGVREMSIPVTFAILTTVAAFLPLMLTEGTMGKVMRQIPIVVISVLAISLMEALLILPAHLAGQHRLPRVLEILLHPLIQGIGWVRRHAQEALARFINGPYARTLEKAVEWRYVTLAAAMALLFVSAGFVGGGFIKFTFMPRVDSDSMVAKLTMQQGTPIEATRKVAARLEAAARQVQEEVDARRPEEAPSVLQHISTTLGETSPGGGHGPMQQPGDSGSNVAEVNVQLLSSEVRDVSSNELAQRWRRIVGEVPGAKELNFSASLFSAGEAVNVELAHRNFDTLLKAVDRLKEAVGQYPGTSQIADSFLPGKRELKLGLTAEGRAAGLTLADLGRQVRSAFYGAEAQRIQRGRDDVRVMVRYPEAQRSSLEDIEHLRVRLPDGREVPFPTVATVDPGRGYAVIRRTDRRRVVSVTADVDEEIANANEINQDLRTTVLPQLRHDFPGLAFSFEGAQRQQRESMASLGLNFILAQIGIFALLAIPFRSYSQPLIVMSAIPFGFIGAVVGHLVMGLDLSLLSMFGIVALTGVVVNDSLIMIDLINRERAEGVPLNQIIRDSGVRRFRPILLTTLTTFLGLTPMILETSLQARFLIPMAVSLGFGVVFATAITLLLVPSLYRILEDFHGFMARSRERRATLEVEWKEKEAPAVMATPDEQEA